MYETMLNMFLELYHRLNRRPLPTVLIWVLVLVILGVFALTGFGAGSQWNRIDNRLVSIPGSESFEASNILNANSTTSYQAYLIVTGVDMEKQHDEVKNVLDSAAASFTEIPGVVPAGVLYPFAQGDDPNNAKVLMDNFIAKDKNGFMMVVLLDLAQFPQRADAIRSQTEQALRQVAADLRSFAPKATGIVTDKDLSNHEISMSAQRDSLLANLIGLVIIFVVLFFATGRVTLTLLAFAATLSGWVTTRAIANLASLIVKPNPEDAALVTMLSLWVVTGYAVLLISRSRTHLELVKTTSEIPQVRPETSRRPRKRRETVNPLDEVFSHAAPLMLISTGLIVLGLLTVAIFPTTSLRWVAIVSAVSVLGCFAIGVTFIPPLLYLAIHWLELPRPRWHKKVFDTCASVLKKWGDTLKQPFTRWKSAHQVLPGILLLAVMALTIPSFGISWQTTGYNNFPPGTNAAAFEKIRSAQYGNTGDTPDVQILGKTSAATMQSWSPAVGKIKGVVAMTARNEEFPGGYSLLNVNLDPNLPNQRSNEIVTQIRNLKSDFPKLVTGQAANQVDFANELSRFIPPLAAVMVVATFLVIWRATRRFWPAFWATLLNVLNLMASLGLTTLVFQDGFGSFLPFLEKAGGVDPNVTVLLVGFGFAMALDYQFYALNKWKQYSPGETDLDSEPMLTEFTHSRGALWTRTWVSLMIFLCFLPMNGMPIKQSAFALAVMVILNSMLSPIFLSPLLEAYPDQLEEDPGLLWMDEETRAVNPPANPSVTGNRSHRTIEERD